MRLRKSLVKSMILTVFIFLSACVGNEDYKTVTSTLTSTPIDYSTNNENNVIGENKETFINFDAGIFFDIASYEDQLPESYLPVFDVLYKNLTALVEYNLIAYNSGFVDDYAIEDSKYYYSEEFQYRFTEIESIVVIEQFGIRVDFAVLGQRLDTTSETIQDIKMTYSILTNDEQQGKWFIYTID